MNFIYESKGYLVSPRKCNNQELRDSTWSAYLEFTNYIPFRPVFYSELRASVCYNMRISDQQFDDFIRHFLIEEDANYVAISSAGSLPYDRDSASLLKSLPPKSDDGKYLIYLKMKRRKVA